MTTIERISQLDRQLLTAIQRSSPKSYSLLIFLLQLLSTSSKADLALLLNGLSIVEAFQSGKKGYYVKGKLIIFILKYKVSSIGVPTDLLSNTGVQYEFN